MSLPLALHAGNFEVEAAPGDERRLVGEAGEVEVGLEMDLHGSTAAHRKKGLMGVPSHQRFSGPSLKIVKWR